MDAKKNNKGRTEIKQAQNKNHLTTFINCLVENPKFDSKFLKLGEKSGVVVFVILPLSARAG